MGITAQAAERRLKPARILGACAAAGLVALSLTAGTAMTRADKRDVAVDVTDEAASVQLAFEQAAAALLNGAPPVALSYANRSSEEQGGGVPGFSGQVLLRADSTGRSAAGAADSDSLGIGDPLSQPSVRAALDIARDNGELVVSAPVVTDGSADAVAVVPLYRGQAGSLSLRSGTTVQDRRRMITGWWLGRIDTATLMTQSLAVAERTDLAAVLADGDKVLQADGEPRFAVRDEQVAAAPRTWTLLVGATQPPGSPGTAWAVGAAGVLLALGVAGLTWWTDRRRQELTEAHRDTQAQLALVTEIAPVVQQSLELADVLPTVSLRLMDDLGLGGVTCSLVGDEGRPIDLFSVGTPVDRSATVRMSVPDQVEAGQTLALALQRGGRSVGVLRVRADRALGAVELGSLSVVADLAAAAIINARLFEQQQEAVARLQQVDELKTVFLGTASHELRTPVTAIVGFAHLLTEGWETFSESDRLEYTQRIARNAHALDRLVQDLLDFARLERGGLRTGRDRVDLSVVIPQAVRGIEPAHPEHHLEYDVDDGAVILGDRSGVERIVNNLISNATKYSPGGTTVRVTVRRVDSTVELIVDDEGPGVADADRERIFSRFYRGAGEEVVRTRGAGIGLSVVQEFVEQMDAEISVTDAPGGGARFCVRFPALERTEPDPAPVQEGSVHVPRA